MPSKPTSGPESLGILQPSGFPGLPDDWEHDVRTISDSSRFSSADPVRLFLLRFSKKEPNQNHRALFICHGRGEHGGRYLHWPHYVQSHFDHVFVVDLRGHGRSSGLRGHIDRFQEYIDDVRTAFEVANGDLQKRNPTCDIHIFGQSMGGLIALRLLKDHPGLPVVSLTVAAPALKLKVAIPSHLRVISRVLSFCWKSLQMGFPLPTEGLSHDPAVQENYLQDRLNHDKSTPRSFEEFSAAMAETRAQTVGPRFPLLIQVPLADPIIDSQATLEYFERLNPADLSSKKKLIQYPDYRHEIYQEGGPEVEISKAKPFEDFLKWIEANS